MNYNINHNTSLNVIQSSCLRTKESIYRLLRPTVLAMTNTNTTCVIPSLSFVRINSAKESLQGRLLRPFGLAMTISILLINFI